MSLRTWVFLIVALTLVPARRAPTATVEKPLTYDANQSSQRAPAPREREGTQITDMQGYFKASGDGAMFYSTDGATRISALPNLNLERVVQLITDNPTQVQWSVSGTLTEFRGTNYLLITRAIARRQAPPQLKRLPPTARPR